MGKDKRCVKCRFWIRGWWCINNSGKIDNELRVGTSPDYTCLSFKKDRRVKEVWRREAE